MIIKYDEPIEVSQDQYTFLIKEYSGVIAHREDEGKFYIKVWLMGYANKISKYLYETKDTTQ